MATEEQRQAMRARLAFARSKRSTFHVGGQEFHDREAAIRWAKANGYSTITERARRGMHSRISQETPTRQIQVT